MHVLSLSNDLSSCMLNFNWLDTLLCSISLDEELAPVKQTKRKPAPAPEPESDDDDEAPQAIQRSGDDIDRLRREHEAMEIREPTKYVFPLAPKQNTNTQ